jgi:hypothetical protein
VHARHANRDGCFHWPRVTAVLTQHVGWATRGTSGLAPQLCERFRPVSTQQRGQTEHKDHGEDCDEDKHTYSRHAVASRPVHGWNWVRTGECPSLAI